VDVEAGIRSGSVSPAGLLPVRENDQGRGHDFGAWWRELATTEAGVGADIARTEAGRSRGGVAPRSRGKERKIPRPRGKRNRGRARTDTQSDSRAQIYARGTEGWQPANFGKSLWQTVGD